MRTERPRRHCTGLWACVVAVSAPGVLSALDDHVVQCRVVDPELSSHLMTYQLGNKLYVQRLLPAPDPAGPFLRGPALRIDTGLPSASQTLNGPEFGGDDTLGFEVVYTKQDAQHRWFVARAAYGCVPPLSDACFVRANWVVRNFANLAAFDNRWRPYASADDSHPAYVSYTWGIDTTPPPTPSPANQRLTWRLLEDENSAEIIADDANALYTGTWGHVDGELRIVTGLGTTGSADIQVALIDVNDSPPTITPIISGAGLRTEASVWFDPASASYLLAYLWRASPFATINEMRLHRRDESTGAWPAEPFLTFTAPQVEDDPGTPRQWLLSVEGFVDERTGRSYVAFSTGDDQAFSAVTDGNIWYASMDATGAPPAFVRMNDTTNLTKRIEPEIHFPVGDGPAIYFTQIATGDDDDTACANNDPMLRRARTGL